jgi:hypothetical protein
MPEYVGVISVMPRLSGNVGGDVGGNGGFDDEDDDNDGTKITIVCTVTNHQEEGKYLFFCIVMQICLKKQPLKLTDTHKKPRTRQNRCQQNFQLCLARSLSIDRKKRLKRNGPKGECEAKLNRRTKPSGWETAPNSGT